MKLLMTAKQEDKPVFNLVITASRITQQGVHAGDNFFSWQDYTFCPVGEPMDVTEASIETLEGRVRLGLAGEHELELWGLVK